MPHCYPEHPTLSSAGERDVWQQLVRDLPAQAHVLTNWRRTDAFGQHECDFIVAWPGHGIFLIEVKGGLITQDAAGQLWSKDRNGKPHAIDPFDQVLRNSHAVADYVTSRWSKGNLFITWLVVFPHTDLAAGFQTAKASREYIVDRTEMPSLVDRLNMLGRRELGTNASADRCELLVQFLADRRDPQKALIEDGEDRRRLVRQLTAEQSEQLDAMADNERFAITGPAGSGKTYLALEQSRRRTIAGERVAFLCYSYGLAELVRRITTKWPESERPAFIGTFHWLGSLWGANKPKGAAGSWWIEDCPRLMLEAVRTLDDEERFDTIVVDEAQDFMASWWTALMPALRDPEHGGLFVFADQDQNVFDRDEVKLLGLPSSRLMRNMRNARPIAELASKLTAAKSTNLGIDGPLVRFEQCAADEAQLAAHAAVERLMDIGWEGPDIALLATKHQPPVQKEYASDDEEEAIARKAEYWELFWTGTDAFYGTVTGFKGLERRVVVLAVDGFGDPGRARETLYAGMTRARDLLIICGDIADIRLAGGDELANALLANQ